MIAKSLGLSLATVVAIGLGVLAPRPSWGHVFAPLRSIVVQVEDCDVVLLVGYRAGSREEADGLVARIANQPKSHAATAMRDVLAGFAMTPLALTVDGRPLVPTAVRAKLSTDAPGGRPMVVLLVTYALGRGTHLSLTTRDPRSTRISWTDRSRGRVDLDAAPAQGKFFAGVASFLLNLRPDSGGSSCARASSLPH
jgi:hypothetical protein